MCTVDTVIPLPDPFHSGALILQLQWGWATNGSQLSCSLKDCPGLHGRCSIGRMPPTGQPMASDWLVSVCVQSRELRKRSNHPVASRWDQCCGSIYFPELLLGSGWDEIPAKPKTLLYSLLCSALLSSLPFCEPSCSRSHIPQSLSQALLLKSPSQEGVLSKFIYIVYILSYLLLVTCYLAPCFLYITWCFWKIYHYWYLRL